MCACSKKPLRRKGKQPPRIVSVLLAFAAVFAIGVGGCNLYFLYHYGPFWRQQKVLYEEVKTLLDKEGPSSPEKDKLERLEDTMLAQFSGYQQQISILLAVSAIVFTIYGIAMPVITHHMDKDYIEEQREAIEETLNQARDMQERIKTYERQLQENLDMATLLAWIAGKDERKTLRLEALLEQTEGKTKSWICFLLGDSSEQFVEQEKYLKQAIELFDEEALYFHLLGQVYSQSYMSSEDEDDDYSPAFKNLTQALQLYSLKKGNEEIIAQVTDELIKLQEEKERKGK